MKITWSFIVLVGLGVVAALGAALFTASLSIDKARDVVEATTSKEVVILVASDNLTALDTVAMDDIVEKTVAKDALPDKYFTDPSQIIGKSLNQDMLEGQMFTVASFPQDGSGAFLAAKLEPGTRAVSIQLSDYEGMQGLLYPGSYVDVLASFKMQNNSEWGHAVSTTLLQNIEVLAVENVVVGSAPKEIVEEKSSVLRSSQGPTVTLLVDTKQAEALQLALKFGQISLALRNPSDEMETDKDATLLSNGRLAQLAEILGSQVDDLNAPKEDAPSLRDMVTGKKIDEQGTEQEVEPAPTAPPVQARTLRQAYVVKGLDFKAKEF
jgi:pilus assembly protein CpaB